MADIRIYVDPKRLRPIVCPLLSPSSKDIWCDRWKPEIPLETTIEEMLQYGEHSAEGSNRDEIIGYRYS